MKELLLIGATLLGFAVISGGMNKHRAPVPSLQPLGPGDQGGGAAPTWDRLFQMLTDRSTTGLVANSTDEDIGVAPVGSKVALGYNDKTAAITPVVIVNEEKAPFESGEEKQAFDSGGGVLDIGSVSTVPTMGSPVLQDPVGIISAGPRSGFSFDWAADIPIDQSIMWTQVVAPSGEIRDFGVPGGFHTSPEILQRAILAMGPPNAEIKTPEPTTAPVLIAPYAPW